MELGEEGLKRENDGSENGSRRAKIGTGKGSYGAGVMGGRKERMGSGLDKMEVRMP